MRRTSNLALLFVALLAACDAPSREVTPPEDPAPVGDAGLALNPGQAFLAPGDTLRFVGTPCARQANPRFASSDASVFAIDSLSGVGRAHKVGVATVSYTLPPCTAQIARANVIVRIP